MPQNAGTAQSAHLNFVKSGVHACLGVTYHLHFWQTGRGLFTFYSSHMGMVGWGGGDQKPKSVRTESRLWRRTFSCCSCLGLNLRVWRSTPDLCTSLPPLLCKTKGKKSKKMAECTVSLTCMASNLACLAFSSLALFLSSCRCCWSSCTTADCRSTSSLFCCSSRRIAASPACRRFWCRLNHSWIFVAAALRVLRYCSAALWLACTSG